VYICNTALVALRLQNSITVQCYQSYSRGAFAHVAGSKRTSGFSSPSIRRQILRSLGDVLAAPLACPVRYGWAG
jgi:hypothetical protein